MIQSYPDNMNKLGSPGAQDELELQVMITKRLSWDLVTTKVAKSWKGD